MYFRTKTVKGTALVQLVESYRNAEGQPRQRVVASLGDASVPEMEKPRIARAEENHLSGNGDLLGPDLSEEAAAWVTRILQLLGRSKSARPVVAEKVDGVLIEGIATENVVELGPQLLALAAWNELGLSDALDQAGLNASQIATAQLLVANRLIEPLSEWALIDWSARTALPELLGIRVTKSTKDRLYHTSDALCAHRKILEQTLRRREADIFCLQRSIVLYDVTNTHFEGLCEKNPKARHGKNKQKRNDCRQVAVGMAFRSAQRRKKENAMLSKAEARFLKDVAALRERITQGRLKDPATIERKIGRLQKNWKTLSRLLSTHSPVTTSLPLEDGRVFHIRKPSLPDPEQALVYKHLRIDWKSAFPQIKTFAKA